jgi:hypothetical protein
LQVQQVPAQAQERARVPALEEVEAVVVVVVAEVVQESALECA